MKKLTVITFSGRPGAGKTTLIRALMAADSRFVLACSTTTRAPRLDDSLDEKKFVSEREFFSMRKANKFLWTSKIHDRFYGTEVACFGKGDSVVLCDVAPAAIEDVRKVLRTTYNQISLLSVYLSSPDISILRRRLEKRGDEYRLIEKKILESSCWDIEAKKGNNYDYYIDSISSVETRMNQIASLVQ